MTRRQIKTLDTLWSKKVRRRGRCEKCGKVGVTHAHHIISRTHRNTRWLIENGVELDYRCHMFFAHKDPVLFTEWITQLRGKRAINRLKKIAQRVFLSSYEEVLDYIKRFKWKIEI